MLFLWDPSMAIGVPLIDEQHQELFRRVNALLAVMHRGSSRLEVERLLQFLAGYATEHFRVEERLMAEHRYPGAPDHRREHAGFEVRLEALRRKFQAEGASCDLSIAVNRLACGWLREHVFRSDVALGRHLRETGATEADGPARPALTA